MPFFSSMFLWINRGLPGLWLFGISILPLQGHEFTVNPLFGDHMVLQREQEIPVWGTAAPGRKITVSLAGQTTETTAGDDGTWMAKLNPLPASTQPLILTITGNEEKTFRDVLIGDVWVCSGQSNMRWPIRQTNNRDEAIPAANHPNIRFFQVAERPAFTPQSECDGQWKKCSPETVADFSAVGYFFARDLAESQKVPIGLIGSYYGGTSAQSWVSLPSLEAEPVLAPFARWFQRVVQTLPQLREEYQQKTLPEWEKEVEEWKKMAEAAKNAGLQVNPPRPPRKPYPPDESPLFPSVLFNGMISPLTPFAIKGVLWYQGEGNARKAREYAVLFPALIKDWRKHWNNSHLPFLFVQLPGFGEGETWPEARQAQTRALSLPNTGMVVALDVGDYKDIHPRNKLPIGQRLALLARRVAYGEDIVASGPVFDSLTIEGNEAHVTFANVGGGLKIDTPPPSNIGQQPVPPADRLSGFEIAGSDGQFFEAAARIVGDAVILTSDSVPAPKHVRYGWAAAPLVNLYNAENLPAAPFSTQSGF